MSHGISGYNGRINLYRQLEQLTEAAPQKKSDALQPAEQSPAPKGPSLGAGLSEAETKMINNFFPESDQMKLRLYGPNRQSETVNPNAVGRRLDVRG